MYKSFLRPLLFNLDPEKAHHLTFQLVEKSFAVPGIATIANGLFNLQNAKLGKEVFGIKFPNPVGLAAGLDKNAMLINEFHQLGFGFIEIGTVTPLPQEGNPKPRLFRLKEDQALINRMGFNNDGVDVVIERLKKRKKGIIVGGNIGKNKITPNDEALNDYLILFQKLHPYVDYFVVNVSSPNTPGLRDLQEKEPLKKLLNALQQKNSLLTIRKPVLLKIAPDLSYSQLDDIIEIVSETGIDGVIATNTTVSREGLKTNQEIVKNIGMGGLSGKPVLKMSTAVVKYIADKFQGRLPIIAVGGIHSPDDALEKLDAGASLVQLYTGFIYEGPALVKGINKAILQRQ